MPAQVEIAQLGPACWKLTVKLKPRHNDPCLHQFKILLSKADIRIDKDYGWSARRYHTVTILAGSGEKAREAKRMIEEWGEKYLP